MIQRSSLCNSRNALVVFKSNEAKLAISELNKTYMGLSYMPTRTIKLSGLDERALTVILPNAKIDMLKGSMRLAVDRVEDTDSASFLSLIEFEQLNVVEE